MLSNSLRNASLFILGFAGTLLYLHQAAPDPNTFWNREFIPHLHRMTEWVGENPESPYLIVTGSSLTVHNVVPAVFERTLEDLGVPVRVFNLGIAGANAHEVNYYLRKTIRHLKAENLALPDVVLIDLLVAFDGRILLRDRGTIKSMEWHDLPETLSAIRSLLLEDKPFRTKRGDLGRHVKSLMRRWIPIGRVHTLFNDPVEAERGVGTFSAGFQTYQWDPVLITEREFEKLIEEKVNLLASTDPPPPMNTAALDEQIAYLEGRGIRPTYFLPPGFDDTRSVRRYFKSRKSPPLLAFDDPRDHSEFWKVAERQDSNHLKSGDPAERFTGKLAAMFFEVLTNENE